MASKVIIVDPWWNQASEQQAFCRVFRIGQKDETFMTRMCVKETVDERLIEMQKTKQREIDEVMEDRGKRTKKYVRHVYRSRFELTEHLQPRYCRPHAPLRQH